MSDGSTSSKNRKRFKTKYGRIGFVAFCVVACSILFYFSFFRDQTLFVFIKSIFSALTPFAIGAVLAYVLKPICVVFEKWTKNWFGKMKNRHMAENLRESLCITFTIAIFFTLLYVLFAAVIPQVIESIKMLVNTLPETYDSFIDWLKGVSKDTFFEQQVIDFDANASENIQDFITKVVEIDAGQIVTKITSGLKGVLGVLKNVTIGMVACIYILAQRKRMAKQANLIINSIFKDKWAKEIMREVRYVDSVFSGFINGKIIDSIIIGVLTFIVTSIFKIPYAVLISVIVGVTNIIPFFGPWIGAVPSGFIVLMASPIKCLYFVIIIIVIQQLDGNVIGPKILGNTTGLSSFWVLFSIVVFGGLFGFMGMLIGVPVFAILYDVIRRLVKAGLAKRGKEEMYLDYARERQALVRRRKKERTDRRRRMKKYVFHINTKDE